VQRINPKPSSPKLSTPTAGTYTQQRNSAVLQSVVNTHNIGPKRARALQLCNIVTYQDAVLHLPRRYVDLRRRDSVASLRDGMNAVIAGELRDVAQRPMRGMRWRKLTTASLVDDAGSRIRVVWFNLPGYARFAAGERVVLSGRTIAGPGGTLEIAHPEIYRLESGAPPPIRPVYSLPAEVSQRLFASLVAEGLDRLRDGDVAGLPDALPDELRASVGITRLTEALRYLHQPPQDADMARLEAGDTPAHRALAFDEMFAFQLALCRERARGKRRAGASLGGRRALTAKFLAGLPFRPTRSQLAAIDEIATGLAQPTQMNRLLIGDVGSGKTLVAFWAALRAVESGYQAAVMAPTELLAEQHYRSFERLCGSLGVSSALLTSKIAGSGRVSVMRALANGALGIVFGTQALIQEQVRIRKLGLAVIDEQHRFGVFDRARLMALGSEANVLLMTATPIPRSLAQVLFRNLDVSSLDEMPPGRTPVATAIFSETAMGQVDAIVRAELKKGNRAYYVLPLIDGEEEDMDSVAAMAKRLTLELKGFAVGALHGRMRPAEKDRVMREFRDGALQVLVSTTVVEVGIDVPEATVIVIVSAERYGLAQLHQLRGRVGRGEAPSQCCLVASNGADPRALERLQVLMRHTNGAEVARADLSMRGPGDLFGARQTGALPLRFARFIGDAKMIEQAADLAEQWLRRDPALKEPASAGARAALERMLDFGFSLGDVG
jgi:ATP-dependent DNA helicase RecG